MVVFFFNNVICLVSYLWLFWVFVAVRGLALTAASRGHSLLATCRLLGALTSLIVEHGLQDIQASAVAACRLSSCGSQARKLWYGARVSLLHGMWDSPEPGTEPMSPALAGRFLSPAPPGKPCLFLEAAQSTIFYYSSQSGLADSQYHYLRDIKLKPQRDSTTRYIENTDNSKC